MNLLTLHPVGLLLATSVLAVDVASAQEWNAASSTPDRIVLTWSEDPTTTQSVTWRTDTTVTRGLVQFALAAPGPEFVAAADSVVARTERLDASDVMRANVVVNFHTATMRQLQPDTVYAYRVGDGVQWSEWFHFRTASRERTPFSFIYFGDAQNSILELWSRMIRGSFAAAPQARFMIHAGDLINNGHDD